MKEVTLKKVRENLVGLEDTIILSLFERMQYKTNNIIYEKKNIVVPIIELPPFSYFLKRRIYCSFLDYFFKETEKVHKKLGRYLDPLEHPFYIKRGKPLIPRKKDILVDINGNLIDIKPQVNFNDKIMEMYLNWIPLICEKGDDNELGSAALIDIYLLQSLSKRVHMGELVAELKFRENQKEYGALIINNDDEGLMRMLTNEEVEIKIRNRVKEKAVRYNVDPDLVLKIYDEMIPSTKLVELNYLKAKRSSLL